MGGRAMGSLGRAVISVAMLAALQGSEPDVLNAQSAAGVSQELRELFEADQADRRPSSAPTREMWEEISARDELRRDRVLELVREDALKVAADFYHAAMVLQHGQESEDILIAHVLATSAAYLGDDRGRWLSAASLDRYLHRTRAPQRLGTQYVKVSEEDPYEFDPSSKWSQGSYESWLPDTVREIFGVEPRDEQEERVKRMNGSGDGDH